MWAKLRNSPRSSSWLAYTSFFQSISLESRNCFSTSTSCRKLPTKLRRDFFNWLNGPGAVFKQPPEPGVTNYLGQYDLTSGKPKDGARNSKMPFPLNPQFVSTSVVSDGLANDVYRRIVNGKSVRMVSAELNISLQRVAAIYRLKTIEEEWNKKGIPTKPFLTKAIHSMLPVTLFRGDSSPQAGDAPFYSSHEPINDLPAYQQTHTQLFLPVSESRSFSRKDAGEAFGIPPADEMIPHPELIEVDKDRLCHVDLKTIRDRAKEREENEKREKVERDEKRRKLRIQKEIVQEVGRWAWRLEDVKTGEIGFRYGVPHEDRKKGMVKIPTRVE